MDSAGQVADKDSALLNLRGRTLRYDDILNGSILDRVAELSAQFQNAKPFPHMVFDGLFSADLLEAICEDFGGVEPGVMMARRTAREVTFRSRPDVRPPRSAQIYFDTVHSGRFVQFLTELTGLAGLVTDPFLQRGGLHESRQGGRFQVHVDFTKHPVTHLDNRLVLITYLNHDWREEFGGALELWAGPEEGCVTKVVPEFGRTVLLANTEASWHGHPTPIQTPDDRPRRSLATYYYSNGRDDRATAFRYKTQFIENENTPWRRAAKAVKYVMPPFLVDAGRLVRNAARARRG